MNSLKTLLLKVFVQLAMAPRCRQCLAQNTLASMVLAGEKCTKKAGKESLLLLVGRGFRSKSNIRTPVPVLDHMEYSFF